MTLLLLFNQPAGGGGSATGTAFRSFVEAGMLKGEWDFDGTLAWTACTHDSTGAAADADAAPTWVIRNAATGAQVATGTMDAVAGVTGQYLDTVALTTANGFMVDTLYSLRVAATVGAVIAAAADVFAVKIAVGRDASGRVAVSGIKNTLDALADFDPATDTVKLDATQGAIDFGRVKITASVPTGGALEVKNTAVSGAGVYNQGAYGQYNQGNIGLLNEGQIYGQNNQGLASGSAGLRNNGVAFDAVGDIGGLSPNAQQDVRDALEADGGKLDHLWEMTEDDGGVRRFTTNALEQAAGSGLSAQEVRDAMKLAPTAGAPVAGSVDKHLDDITAATSLITDETNITVIVRPAVTANGQITLYQGYDYTDADERAVEFAVATPDFTGATAALKCGGVTYAGTVVDPGLTTQTLRFEFTAAQTTAMIAGHHAYRVEVTRAGRLLLEELGVIHVKE